MKAFSVSVSTAVIQTDIAAGAFSTILEMTGQFVGNIPPLKHLGATIQTTVDAQSYTWIVRPGGFVESVSKTKLEVR